MLKAFFEGAKSGGCPGAVANVDRIKPGVFHVTFCDHKGEKYSLKYCYNASNNMIKDFQTSFLYLFIHRKKRQHIMIGMLILFICNVYLQLLLK